MPTFTHIPVFVERYGLARQPKDLIDVQKCNQYNLPENYPMASCEFSFFNYTFLISLFTSLLTMDIWRAASPASFDRPSHTRSAISGIYSIVTWPEVSLLAEDSRGKIVGYVLASV